MVKKNIRFTSDNRDFIECHHNEKGMSRRDFMKGLVMTGAALSATGGLYLPAEADEVSTSSFIPVKLRTNPFTKDGKPILVVVTGTNHEKMLMEGLNTLIGFDKIVNGKDILIKPNFLMDEPYPTTTDPDFAILLAQHLKNVGANQVTLCDSSQYSESGSESAFRFLKIYEKGKKAGVKVISVDLEKEEDFAVVERSDWESHPHIKVNKHILKADMIINTPVLKRHVTAGLTCALKNHFGSVYGSHRWMAHRASRMGKEGLNFFMKSVAEFADAARPELTIVDARSILTGMGPAQQMPGAKVKKGVNRIIFSGDMVATDVYCSRIMKEHDESFSPSVLDVTWRHAQKLGLGTMDLTQVKVVELTA